MRINLGSGTDFRRGYENLDIRDLEGPTRCDVSDPDVMAKYKGADEILAYDILEHFPRKKAREVLKMWVGLLKPGGVIKIRCPDIRHAVEVAPNDEWLELLLYGGQDYKENQHLCGFTAIMLSNLLMFDCNCSILRRELTIAGNVEIWACK